ncbi:glycosyltransferase family 4 protein [Pontibacter silvestris]|uniref:Glycosyltransferase family 4 protein n=1 Tax=Pontibacter silvestris TaxID=2305183 RepID=A0ABW4WVT1_9BACT|nr:glycosyltransferase family 4 protein [Pontibacter silvestris]MCC9137330.1 glycosyltransferase family 4 protein [Pontibacter silvestris]
MSYKPDSIPTKILFLYTELAGYFIACVEALIKEHQVEVHMVRWPINKEAPFQLAIPDGVTVYDKQQYSREQLIQLSQAVAPDLVFCTGWIDKDYLAVARTFKKQVPVLVGMDNHWHGSARQQIARLLAPFTLQRIFTHAFVAGAPQQKYALKLGFRKQDVLQGYYSADVRHFQKAYQESKFLKENVFPKRFIYVGRYVQQKGIQDMWEAFVQLQQELPNDWELWCLGTGPLEAEAAKHPNIKHVGFVQPEQMQEYISQTGVFVLPSHKEPWGVVVHEFAAAGFPLICSTEVGAATAFLKDKLNGYTFEAGNVAELKQAMKKVVLTSEADLLQMGEQSVTLALQNTPSKWAAKLLGLVRRQKE